MLGLNSLARQNESSDKKGVKEFVEVTTTTVIDVNVATSFRNIIL